MVNFFFFFYSVVNTSTKNEKKLQRGSQNVAARNLKILTFLHDKIGIWACVTAVSAHILFFNITREKYGVCVCVCVCVCMCVCVS